MLSVLVVLASLGGAWWLLVHRPARIDHHRHAEVLSELKPGSVVMTVGGIFGRIVEVNGTTAVLELADGLVTRLAVDGIARMASPSELPPMPARQQTEQENSAPETNVAMYQNNDPQHPQPQYPQPQVRQHVQVQPTAYPQTTMVRPQLVQPQPSQQSLYRPRPFSVKPWTPPAIPGGYGSARAQAPQASSQPFQRPASLTAQPVSVPANPVQHQPVYQQAVHAPEAPAIPARSVPQGMGATMRFDSPELAQTVSRARQERAELAAEYQRHTQPLVAVDTPSHIAVPTAQNGFPGPQFFSSNTPPAVQHVPAGNAGQDMFPAPARPPEVRVVAGR